MTNLLESLSTLRRPGLLIRAARHGLQDYDRTRDLHRLTGLARSEPSEGALATLMAQEAELEETRQSGEAHYRATRHIALLVALMAEARLLQHRPAAG